MHRTDDSMTNLSDEALALLEKAKEIAISGQRERRRETEAEHERRRAKWWAEADRLAAERLARLAEEAAKPGKAMPRPVVLQGGAPGLGKRR